MLLHVLRATLLVLTAAIAIAGPAFARDRVIQVPNNDAEMVEAIARARATLPDFWAKFQAKPADIEAFSVKVRIPYGKDHAEHCWLSDIETDGKQHSGVIGNEPNNATNVKKGERYNFTDAEISDWLYLRHGKIIGNETMRPLLKRMPPDKAAHYRAMYETP